MPINPRFPAAVRRTAADSAAFARSSTRACICPDSPGLRPSMSRTCSPPRMRRSCWRRCRRWRWRARSTSTSCCITTAAKPTIISRTGARSCIRGFDSHTTSWCRRSTLRDVFARHGHTAHVIPNVVDLSRFAYRAAAATATAAAVDAQPRAPLPRGRHHPGVCAAEAARARSDADHRGLWQRGTATPSPGALGRPRAACASSARSSRKTCRACTTTPTSS